jgi:hypothetical protein
VLKQFLKAHSGPFFARIYRWSLVNKEDLVMNYSIV